jgi:CheY-like chemotaxis protein
MSHEMRTPLNAIIGLTLLNLENELLDEETRSNLEKTHNAGTSLLGIVNDILDISKIESGKLELVPIEYNPASLINDAITQNLLRMGDKPIKLTLDIDKNIFSHLIGDELRLKQIMNNLLSNAIKYTEEGEVILSVHNVREDNDVWLTIKVSDSGQGIKSEDIGKLFDDYSQLDTKANRKIEGTGLGLPITKRLCQLMGGFIKVESKYGKGSIFTVKLKQEYVTDEVIGPEVVASLNNFRYSDGRRDQEIKLKRISLPYARVLVVDDNPTNLDVARGLMKPYGMTIDCVDSGQKAIDAMSDKEPVYDAVFMDQMMPGMDGIEAARRIRGLDTEYAQKIPIIALTANAIVGNEEMFLSKGFQAFLSKPIDLARLDAVIRQWIRNREKEKQYINEGVQHGISYKNEVSQLKDKKVAGLDIEAGVKRFNDDEDVYINILQSYAVNTRKLLETIKDKPGEKLNNYEVTVHSIKGSSYGICADVAGRLAADLEKAAKAIEPEYIRKHHQQFMDVTWKLIGNIEDLLASLERGGPKPKMDKPDEEVISRLADACDAYDMDGVDAAMEEIAFYQYENDNNLVNWLKENVDLMNFEEIVERLRGEI